jgi:hypothetical protein
MGDLLTPRGDRKEQVKTQNEADSTESSSEAGGTFVVRYKGLHP